MARDKILTEVGRNRTLFPGCARLLFPLVDLKEQRLDLFWHADAIVTHIDLPVAGFPFCSDRDLPVCVGEFQSVANQVAENRTEHVGVGADHATVLSIDDNLLILLDR